MGVRSLPRLICALIAAAALAGPARADDPGARAPSRDLSMKYWLPRDYGYFLGDLVEVSYKVQLPPGQTLNADSLANERPKEAWFELKNRRIEQGGRREPGSYALFFVYQVFSAGEGAKSFEIPGVRFSFGPKENPSASSHVLPAVPIVVSSLASEGARFQPPLVWIWDSPTPQHLRLIGLALLLGSTLPFFFWERKRLRVHSPFRAARRKISREKDPIAALILFRGALNEKAGKAIFPQNLSDLFAGFPQARPYEQELREMIGLSDEMIFNPQNTVPREGLIPVISALAEKLRRAEKWE